MYTAAFQGRPNGAMLSQINLMTQDLILARAQDLSSDTVFLNSGPLFHIGTLKFTFATFHLGGTNIFVRRSDAQTIADAIHTHRCTYGFVVGKTIQKIVELNRDRRYDLKSFRAEHYGTEWSTKWARMVTILPLDKRPRWGGYAARQRNGWHYTNDLGRREADGTISFIFVAAIPRKSPFEIDYRALDAHFGAGNHPGAGTPVA